MNYETESLHYITNRLILALIIQLKSDLIKKIKTFASTKELLESNF